MKNLAGSLPQGRTDLEIFLFENFGLYVDFSQDTTILPLAILAVLVPVGGLLKGTLFS